MPPETVPFDFGPMLELSHALGDTRRELAILGEGNTSMRVSDGVFAVKASGQSLSNLASSGVTLCNAGKVLGLLELSGEEAPDVDAALLDARVDKDSLKPSVESLFHAYLLSLPGINFVGHTHPIAVNQILCSRHAELFAERRMFPDQIVCCGPSSPIVQYVDPGLELSRCIRDAVESYIDIEGIPPVVILLRNHGMIAMGKTSSSVLAATLMMEKSAQIFVGASTLNGGEEPFFMSQKEVDKIFNRPDEHYRKKMLDL